MTLPGISTTSNPFPLLGAGQPPASSDPPRAANDRRARPRPAVKRPARIVRFYIVRLAAAMLVARAIHGKTLMSVSVPPVAPQPRVRFRPRRPAPGVRRSHAARILQTPRTASARAADFRLVGRTVHRRPLPGHVMHHRLHRNVRHRWLHRRRSLNHAATTAAPDHGRGAQRPDLHSPRLDAATSDADQEPDGPRLHGTSGPMRSRRSLDRPSRQSCDCRGRRCRWTATSWRARRGLRGRICPPP